MTERNNEVGTNGGLSQRWRSTVPDSPAVDPYDAGKLTCASELGTAKIRIEEAVKALRKKGRNEYGDLLDRVDRDAVLKIIREIL